jgi:hypothetical protein
MQREKEGRYAERRGRGRERCIEKGGGAATFLFRECREQSWLRVRKSILFIVVFFLSAGLVEPVRFGSVQSVSDFGNRNRTEPKFFCDFLIG